MITACASIETSAVSYAFVERSQPNSRALAWYSWKPVGSRKITIEPDQWKVRFEPVSPLSDASEFKSFGTELRQEIEQASKAILSLEEDWDGNGGSPYNIQTVERAASFILALDNLPLWRSMHTKMPSPAMGPGPDGSIDIFWQRDDGRLLVNIPGAFGEVATLYGSNLCGGQRAKDSFELSQFSRVAPWLMILIGR